MRFAQWIVVAAAATGLLAADAGSAQVQAPVYKDPRQPVEKRVEDLLARMTLDEKVAQLETIWENKAKLQTATGDFSAELAAKNFPNGIGGFARPSDYRGVTRSNGAAGAASVAVNRDARQTAEFVNAAQHWAVEHTRLGIPILMHEESLHGYVARGATSFPAAIGLASTWDPDTVTKVFSVAAREARARGATLVLAPVVDVAKDPRWGRIEETFGEDPYLDSQMGLATIRGFQGPTLPLPADKVFVTLKHFTGHGAPEAGTNVGPAHVGERELRTDFFPPFEAAVKNFPIQSVMPSYNEIDGIPSHANSWLLNGVLRGEWGYQGAVVSDYYGIRELIARH
jgi:beta-glucosidase